MRSRRGEDTDEESRDQIELQSLLFWNLVDHDRRRRKRGHAHVGFNPCCSGTWSIIRFIEPENGEVKSVSILVVLELGRSSLGADVVAYIHCICFNPCCSGTWSIIPDRRSSRSIYFSFNPCCSGTWSIMIETDTIETVAIRFNPCCSGTWSIMIARNMIAWATISFNPCCSGTWSIIREPSAVGYRSTVSILVVLELGRSFGAVAIAMVATEIRFNPCCSGTWSIMVDPIDPEK